MWVTSKQNRGFTIVELLIVIVVIGILAAITIVAFNGVQKKAQNSATQAAATQAVKKMMAYAALNSDTLPAELEDAGVTDGGSTSYQYTVNNSVNPKTYCVTVTTGTTSYYINSTNVTTPMPGGCPGDGQGGVAPITNLLPNPSIETNETNLANIGSPAARTIARVVVGSSSAYSGNAVFRVQSTSGGTLAGFGSQNTTNLPLGTYVASLWVRSNTSALSVAPYLEGTSTRTSLGQTGGGTFVPNTWRRITFSFNMTVTGTVKVGFLTSGTAAAGDYVDMDGLMLTAGTNLYNFADGSSLNWEWQGTEHLSPSNGPPSQ